MGKHKSGRKSRAYLLNKSLSIVFLMPVIFIVSLIPLIVYMQVIELNDTQAALWRGYTSDSGVAYHFDFFSYQKALVFMILTYVSVFITLFLVWRNEYALYHSVLYKPLIIYGLFVVLSYLFSSEKSITTLGMMDMYQGVFVLLGYVLVVVLVYNLVKTKNHLQWLIGAYIFVGVVVGLIAVSQYLGHDVLRTDFMSNLILPDASLAEDLQYRFGPYTVYATMQNTNFVGSFAALMIPFAFALYLYVKRPWQWLLALAFFGLMVFVGFGSNSRAGIIGTISAFVLMLVMFRRFFLNATLKITLPFVLIVVVGYGLNDLSDGRVMQELSRLNPIEDKAQAEARVHFKTVKLEDNTMIIETSEASFEARFAQNRLTFYTLDGDMLEVTGSDQEDYRFVDEAYEDIRIIRTAPNSYQVRLYHERFNLYLHQEGLKVRSITGDLTLPEQAATINLLDGYERMFSSRIYLWTRSAALLPNYLLIGEGPDMFLAAFPQDDVAGRLNAIGFNNIITMPHNMYLQIGINTGFISLLALLTAFGLYLVASFKLYLRRSLNTFAEMMGVGVFVAVMSYLITGMFNDQIISVAPLFYVMLGLGLALNRMNQQNNTLS